MIIVTDTNILISALIKDSLTRRIIIGSGMNFCYPEISLHELRKHKKMIMDKAGLTKDELEDLLDKILEYAYAAFYICPDIKRILYPEVSVHCGHQLH